MDWASYIFAVAAVFCGAVVLLLLALL